MKYLLTILMAILMSAICNSLTAQEKSVEVSVDLEVVNGEEQRNVLIKIGEGDANKEIKWKDNGTVPDEIKELLEKEGIDIKMISGDDEVEITVESVDVKKSKKQVEIIKIISEDDEGEHAQDRNIDIDGDSEITIIQIKGDQEIPEDVQKLLDEHDIDIEALKKEALHEAKDHDTKVIKKKAIKVMTIDDDGNESVIEWEGDDGELPEDIQKLLEDEGIDLDGEHQMIFIGEDNEIKDINISKESKKQYRIKTIDEDGNEKVIEWNGEGEMPEEMKKAKAGAKKKVKVIKKKSSNRAQLGVIIEDNKYGLGADVVGVVKGMPADRIGIKAGAIITMVNDQKVKNIQDLMDALKPHSPGESITIDYMDHDTYYGGIEVTLKKSEDHPNHLIFKDVANSNYNPYSLLNDVPECDPKEIKKNQKALNNWRANKEIPTSRQLTLKNFSAYPNPTNDRVKISFEGNDEPTVIQLIDIAGQEVHKEVINNFDGVYSIDLDLSNYAKGQFFLYIIQNQKIFTESIILQ